jgi:hypothetical protein
MNFKSETISSRISLIRVRNPLKTIDVYQSVATKSSRINDDTLST